MSLNGLKRLIQVVIMVLVFGAYAYSQSNPYGEVSIASPSAASLGKYADIPVSYHTGIPQIEIPLYTVQAGPLKLPISISYHASGLKVIETASWVGAGWSLNAGGVITRSVMGQPDESNTSSGAVNTYGYFSNFGYNKYLYQGVQDWLGFAQGRKDGEPDLFFFNFGSYSGKFYFRDDRTPILVPQQDIKIEPYYTSLTASIQGFTLTTPDGVKYIFGNTPGVSGFAPIEITNPYSAENGYSSGIAASSWFLNKIVSSDGIFSISLQYASETYGYYTLSSYPLDSSPNPNGLQPVHEFNLVKNIINGVHLSQISFPNGVVTFKGNTLRTDLSDNGQNTLDNLNGSAPILDSISIASNGSFCKKFVFKTGYFTDNTSTIPGYLALYTGLNTDTKRLRLDSVQEISCDNSLTIPAYKFTYFTELVPRRLNLGIDHWGFYNAVTNNQTLIPTYTTFDGTYLTPVPGANRNSTWPAMRGGSLQKITYPVGGSTTFDFEPCDNYTKTSPILQPVNIVSSNVHLYGQDTKYSDTQTFTSDGQPITISTFNNTQDYLASLVIKSGSTTVYSLNFGDNNYTGGGQNATYIPFTLAAGTYQITLSIPNGPPDNQGAIANLSQLTTLYNSYPVIIGGLRIRTITNSTGSSDPSPIVTNYSYPLGAYLYSFPTYIQHMRNDLVTTYGFWSPVDGFHYTYGTINGCTVSGSGFKKSGGSLRPMSTTQGYHVGYPVVKVSQTGNGYSLYNYYASNSGYAPQTVDPTIQTIDVELLACEPTAPNYPAAPLPFDYKKGELAYEQHFNETGQLLKDVYYYPEYDTTNLLPTPGFIVTTLASGALLGTFYNLYSPRRTKTHVIETNYAPGIGSVTTHTYTYYGSPYHNQVTRKAVSTSTGDSLITITKYSSDFHLSSCDVSPTCEISYTNNCSACLANKNAADLACSGQGNLCYTNSLVAYWQCLSNSRNSYVDCRATNYTGIPNNYSTQLSAAINAAGTELKPILVLMDSNRVVPIEESQWKDANLLHANFTRYDFVTYPVGIPYPNKTQLINLQAPSSTFSNAVVSGTTIAKDNRYLDETTYTFTNGNPGQVISHDGVPISYIWDYINTNPIAKVSNATVDQIAFTSFEADGQGGWTFSGMPTIDAAAVAGYKDYTLTGSNNITKSGLLTTKSFIVSYWSKTGSATVNGVTATSLISKRGWNYYEHKITAGVSTVTVSGSVTIDGLRLYPSDAQMTTYTYSPLVGMTSMEDVSNHISYYQYDNLARLKTILDQDGNIIKTIDYHFKVQ